ncbi:MAG: DUF1223 domain-containing protein [Pseudomonadota bacterium]
MTAALGLGTVATAADEPSLVVLELYTSQGCSSCPPADALMHTIAKERADVLPLSFHVDYWDYIGWTDTFADPTHSERQKTYARNFKERMVYTPQVVVNGSVSMVGHKAKKLNEAVSFFEAQAALVSLSLVRTGEDVVVNLRPLAVEIPATELHLVRYKPEATVQIGRGENAGRSVTYTNVVMDWHVAWVWDGSEAQSVTLPAPGPMPVAVILQERGLGPVLAAAQLE